MTAPGTGGAINLAALWVPVMPETSHMGEEMRKAGAESKRQFEQGFNSGTSPENMGQGFAAKLHDSITKGMSGFDLPLGMSSMLDKFSADIDTKLVAKLKGEATKALQQYRQEYDNLTAAQGRAVEAENKVSQAREGGFNKASILLPLMREQSAATKDLESANTKAGASFENYNTKVTKLTDVTKAASDSSGIMAGVMGGLVVAGANALVGAIDSVVEHIIEGAVEAFRMGVEGAKEFADTMIELGETYEHIGIQIQEFSSASGDSLEEFEHHAQSVFGQLDVAGKNTGQTMAQFASMMDVEPSAALDRLTGHVEELQGRFTSLRATDLASIFNVFKTPMAETDSALASLLQSARNSGQDLGQFASALQGNVAITLREANLNLEQAGAFTGELLKMGEPGRQAMTGMATAMKEFGKEGLSFSDGMQLAGEKLKQLGDTAEGQDLAEKLFGTRNWIVAKQAVQEYIDVVAQGPNAFAASSSSIDEFTEKTRTLQNEWELVKHKVEEAFLPMGLEAVGFVSAGLDKLVAFVNTHMDQIKNAVTRGGVELIRIAAELQKFGEGMLEFFAPIVNAIDSLVGNALNAMGSLAHGAGDILSIIPGMGDFANGLIDAGKGAETMGIKLTNLNVGQGMKDIAEWSKQHRIDVQGATEDWVNFASQVGQSSTEASDSITGTGAFGQGNVFNPGGPGAGLMPPSGVPGIGGSPSAPGGFNIGGAGAGGGGAAHKADWDAIAQGESTGNWNQVFNTGVPLGGGLQIKPETWYQYGGLAFSQYAYQATKEQQIQIAERILNGWGSVAGQGPGAWPGTYAGFAKGGDPGRFVTQGSGNGDDVAALLGKGEYVWDTDTMDKYGWLIKALHGGAMGFDGGGGSAAYAASGAGNDDVGIDPQLKFIEQIASGMGLTLTAGKSGHGTHQIDGGWHDSGQAADFSNGMQTDAELAFAMYMIQHFGSELAEVIHTDPRLPQLIKDGKLVDPMFYGADTLAGHKDHVHIAIKATQPLTDQMSPGSEPLATGAGFTAMSFGSGSIPTGKGQAGFPGLPGQYGGGGAYGGQTADQAYSTAQAVQSAKDRAADLDYSVQKNQQRIDDLKSQLAQVGQGDLGMLTGKPMPRTPAQIASDDQKRQSLQTQLDDATHALAVSQRDRAEQDGKITEAERKQQESALKPPPGSKTQKPTGEAAFSQLGQGLLSGIASDLGFGDILGKSPMDWGIVKLATGLASWGIGTANAWADEIGKGHTGLTGGQPIPGWDTGSGGGGGASGLLSGMMPSLSGLMPKSNVSAGPNIKPGIGQIGVQGTGPAPGPVVAGDYMPINITQTQPDTNQIMTPVQNHLQSSQFTTMSPHGPGT